MQTKVLLDESEIPTHWYNVVADMPNPPAPILGPDGNPLNPEALLAIFPPGVVEQEVSTERWIEIPGLEAKKQFEKAGDYPDMIFALCGGGSNFGGAAFPFFADKAAGKDIRASFGGARPHPTFGGSFRNTCTVWELGNDRNARRVRCADRT